MNSEIFFLFYYPFINYLFLFISHSSSYLSCTIGYPFINYELSMHYYQLSIQQYTCLILVCRWKTIACIPLKISNKNVYWHKYVNRKCGLSQNLLFSTCLGLQAWLTKIKTILIEDLKDIIHGFLFSHQQSLCVLFLLPWICIMLLHLVFH